MERGIETEVNKRNSAKKTQNFYGNGKLLISGEYFVLDGAVALALPTTFGQKLMVSHKPSFNPTLTWKSYDEKGKIWFESEYEFWHFRCLRENPSSKAIRLQELLLAFQSSVETFGVSVWLSRASWRLPRTSACMHSRQVSH